MLTIKKYKRVLKITASLVSVASLSACMVGPNFHPPLAPKTNHYTALPLPAQTVNIPGAGLGGVSQQFMFGQDLSGDWWTVFHSPALNALIQQGLKNNQTLAAAKAALEQAQYTLYSQAGGLMLPTVNFQLNAQRALNNGLAFGVSSPSQIFNIYDSSIQASYLIDVWGASRRQIESDIAQVAYQRYELMAAYLTMTSNIATTSITIAGLQTEIQATQALIKAQTNILKVSKQQLSVGGVNIQNVLLQEATLGETQATLPPLIKSLSQSQHALAVLVGALPSKQLPLMLNLDALVLPRKVPVSLPSSLVKQRPDIQASEALLHAASAQVGVATANLLPQITLSAGYGWLASSPSTLFNPASSIWSLAAGLTQPVFHGGALFMQKQAAMAGFKEAAAEYQQTVLQAFQNVADALRAIQIDAEQFKARQYELQSAKKGLQVISQQYQVGGQNYLAVLNAQEQYQRALIDYVRAQTGRYTDTAALYQSLGGGWWNNAISQYRQPALHSKGKSL